MFSLRVTKIIKGNKKCKKMILAEKREVALSIAEALLQKPMTAEGYIEGEEYVVTWCNGHMFTIKDPEDYDDVYKEWHLETLPFIPDKFELKMRRDTKKQAQFEVLSKLVSRQDIESIILATDAAREGELLGNYILQKLNNKKPVYRFWSSSINKKAVIEAMNNLKLDSEYRNMFLSAKTRNEMDYLIGINFSRAYSLKTKNRITIGRCMTAILNLICIRDEEIEKFKSEFYSEVLAEFDKGYTGKYISESRLTKDEALKIKSVIKDGDGVIEDVVSNKTQVPHPLLFNLTELQRTCIRKFGYTAQETVDVLEKLYLSKLISYPRSSSQFITQKEVPLLKDIFKMFMETDFKSNAEYCLKKGKLNLKRVVNDELVSDHYAIIPEINDRLSDEYKLLNEKEKLIFKEIVTRFFSVFYDPYEYESMKIVTKVDNYEFVTNLQNITNQGWKKAYENDIYESKEKLPQNKISLEKGEKTSVTSTSVVDKRTAARPHYTEDTLLEIMANPKRLVGEEYLKSALKGFGIGTEATRADIIESLIRKEYVIRQQKNLISTELGRLVIKYVDIEKIKSVEMTAEMEYNLSRICEGEISAEVLMDEYKEFICNSIKHIKEAPDIKIEKKEAVSYGICPLCKKGRILKNRTGYGCSELKTAGCRFYVNEFIGETMTRIDGKQIEKLAKYGETDILVFKNNGSVFKARIKFNNVKKKTEFKKC